MSATPHHQRPEGGVPWTVNCWGDVVAVLGEPLDQLGRAPGGVRQDGGRCGRALQGFRRVTTGPVTVGGTELPPGATVFVAFGGANRDADRHPRAEEFDITRPPGRHLAFGFGVQGCPGCDWRTTGRSRCGPR